MFNFISLLQKKLIIVIPITMVLGFLFGLKLDDVTFLKGGILPLTFLMVYPMMINLQLKKVLDGGDTKVQVAAQLLNFLVTPFIAFAIGRLFFKDNTFLALGILLTGLLPTSGMTISWTGMAKGNMPAAVKMTVIGLLLGSILTPIYIKLLMGATVTIEMVSIFKQIAIIVVIPLILGNITQKLIILKMGMAHYQEKLKKKISSFSTLGVVGIVFVAMALKSKSIVSNPTTLIWIFLPLLLLYIINILISTLIGKIFFNRGDAIALLYGTVMRNLSIALAIAMTAFGKEGADIALVVALGYIIQVQLAAWYVHFTDRIFGEPGETEAADIMHYGIFSLHSNQTISDAIAMLSKEEIHSLVVLDSNDNPMGMINDKIIIKNQANNNSISTQLSEIELASVVTSGLHKKISDIIDIMKDTENYKVIITNDKKETIGVVSAKDLLGYLK